MQRKRWSPRVTGRSYGWTIPLLVFSGLLGTSAVSQAAEGGAPSLTLISNQYAQIRTVHLRSTAQIVIHELKADGPRLDSHGVGTVEYWADGTSYRIEMRTTRNLGLADDWVAAYNGRMYQMVDGGNQILSVQEKDSEQFPSTFPNPLFLPVDFASKDDDNCDSCMLRVFEVADRVRAREETQSIASPSAGAPVLVVPIGKVQGQRLTARVLFGADSRFPSRIDRLTSTGAVISTVVLKDYAEVD